MKLLALLLFAPLLASAFEIRMWENKGFKGSWIWRHVSEDTYNQCIDLGGLDNKITSFMIWDGCCAFYANKGCNDLLFVAKNRYHDKIGKWHNDIISSYKCNWGCEGV